MEKIGLYFKARYYSFMHSSEGGQVITRQLESAEVNYPDGACLQNCPFGAIDPCTRAQIVTFLYLLFAE